MKKITITKFVLSAAIGLGSLSNINAQESTATPNEFVPSGGIWGVVFGDYAFKNANDSLQRGGGNVQYKGYSSLNSNNTTNAQSDGFQIRRAYLGYDYQIAPKVSTVLVLANEQNLDASGKNTVYLKYANVKINDIFKGSDLVIGQLQTAAYSSAFNTSPLWGYRSVERTLLDQHNIDNSTDLGVSLQGQIYDFKSAAEKPSFLGYVAQVGNGNGALPNGSNYKKVRLNLYGTFLSQSLTVGFYTDYSLLQQSPYQKANTTLKAYVNYSTKRFKVGAEVFEQINEHSDKFVSDSATNYVYVNTKKLAVTYKNGVQAGLSVFASAQILPEKLSAFARYDIYTPDLNFQKGVTYQSVASNIQGSNFSTATFYQQNFITAGLDYSITPQLHVLPNVWYNGYTTTGYDSPELLTLAAGSSSKIVANDRANSSTVKNNYDLVWRLTFSFVFNSTKNISRNAIN